MTNKSDKPLTKDNLLEALEKIKAMRQDSSKPLSLGMGKPCTTIMFIIGVNANNLI